MEINISFKQFTDKGEIRTLVNLIDHAKTIIGENGREIQIRVPDLPKALYANRDNLIFESYFDVNEEGVEQPNFWYNKPFFDHFHVDY